MSNKKKYCELVFSPEEGMLHNTEQEFRNEICLNGRWEFQGIDLPKDYQKRNQPLELTKYNDKNWDEIKIKIPSPWDVNNFTAQCNKPGGDFLNFPSYPEKWKDFKMAWHKKMISIPEEWDENEIFLHFEAICGYAEVYINEKKIGQHFDLSLPASFNITKEVLPGKNYDLYVGIRDANLFNIEGKLGDKTYPTGSFWSMNIKGIWQDVYLLSYPKVHIKDVFVQPDVKNNFLIIETTIKNTLNKDITLFVDGLVKPVISKAYDDDDIIDITPQHNLNSGIKLEFSRETLEISANTEIKYILKKEVNNQIKLWNPEDPNLYAIILSLYIENNKIDTKYQRFGWRQFLIENENLTLNGKKIQILGDSWHFMGIPQLTRRYAFAWYKAIKDAGGNGVRLHAMPFPRFYLEVADEIGICILDETAIWASQGSFNYEEDITWKKFEDHLRALIFRDRNYPSVMGWSIENEIRMALREHSSSEDFINNMKEKITRMFNITKELDPTRDWISGDGSLDWEGILPTYVLHYGRPKGISGYKRTKKLKKKPCGVGECTIAYFGTPIHASKFIGDKAFFSIYNRMCAVALETYNDLKEQIKADFSYCSVFNLAWYGLKPLPFGHQNVAEKPDIDSGIYFKDYVENKPGIQPERLGPYSSTFNPGYDKNLPLYDPWPMFDAIRSAFQKEEFKAPIEKSKRKPEPIVISNPLEPFYIGDENIFFEDLVNIGCIFSKDDSSSIKIIDMSSADNKYLANIKNEIENQSNKKYLFFNIDKKHQIPLSNLLKIDIKISESEASSLVYNSENIISKYFNLSELYFSELEESLIQKYSVSFKSISEDNILMESCSCDWTYWNTVQEETKTGALFRTEKEGKKGPALVKTFINENEIILSTVLFKPALDIKRKNFLEKFLQVFGVKIDENRSKGVKIAFQNNILTNLLVAGYFKYSDVNDALNNEELLSKLDNLPNTQSSAKDETFNFKELKLEGNSEKGFILVSFYLDSIRRIDDLLTEPNVPELNLNLNTDCIYKLYLNNKEISSNSEFKAFDLEQRNRLLLKKGKNYIVIKLINNQKDFKLKAILTSNNAKYLKSLKSQIKR